MSKKHSSRRRKASAPGPLSCSAPCNASTPKGVPQPTAQAGPKMPRLLILSVIILLVIGTGGILMRNKARLGDHPSADQLYAPLPKGSMTFSKDIAPIVFRRCVGCHRPDEAAPFSLLTYDQVKKRARQIAEVTARRYMPPWPPEPGYGEFVEARVLTA